MTIEDNRVRLINMCCRHCCCKCIVDQLPTLTLTRINVNAKRFNPGLLRDPQLPYTHARAHNSMDPAYTVRFSGSDIMKPGNEPAYRHDFHCHSFPETSGRLSGDFSGEF